MKRRSLRGHQGCAYISYLLFETMDTIIEFDYEITCEDIPASYDEPASSMEYEVKFTGMYEDTPNAKYHPKKYLDVPLWLEALLNDFLQESNSVYDAICSNLEGYDDDCDL